MPPFRMFVAAIAVSLGIGYMARALPATNLPRDRPACEPYVDVRELRFRAPAATVSGQVVAGSVVEDGADQPAVGQQLVFGTAQVIDDARPLPVRISYVYWKTTDGCNGWEPARGGRYVFELADDKASDGALRVMRYGAV